MEFIVMSMPLPPTDFTKCIGIICNGEIENTTGLRSKLQACHLNIGVDGGLKHCKSLNIVPKWIVGDFDSIDSSTLEEFKGLDSINLKRAKDVTDLEVAIDQAKALSSLAQIIIFGGLGGRLDHTLTNIFLLLRNPGQLFLESEKQVLFAVSETSGEVQISHSQAKTLALFPLNGPTKVILSNKVYDLDRCHPLMIPFNEKCLLKVISGEVLVILDQNAEKPLAELPLTPINTRFTLEQPLIHIFSHLAHQSLHFRVVKLLSEEEQVINIQKDSGEITFQSQKGQTISLIPLYGAAKGIKTKGLKWELGENLDQLDKNFIGISNVCLGNSFTVAVNEGQLLCIVNKNLIDEEMVSL
jgi:thiamine pyrophosphokinase